MAAATPSTKPGFFRRVFGSQSKYQIPLSLAGKLVAPRDFPKALASSSTSEPLRSLWGDLPTDEAASGIYHECISELARVLDIRVTTVAAPAKQGNLPRSVMLSGAEITIELVVAGANSQGVYQAPQTTRTVTRRFGACRELLDLLSFCVTPNDPCGCIGDQCEYRAAMREFLSTCWVHPPIIHGTTMQWGGGDGGVAAGIRKSVLTASLRVIADFAQGKYGPGAAAESKPPSEVGDGGAALPSLGAINAIPDPIDVKCRAQLEVAVVVHSFFVTAKDREF